VCIRGSLDSHEVRERLPHLHCESTLIQIYCIGCQSPYTRVASVLPRSSIVSLPILFLAYVAVEFRPFALSWKRYTYIRISAEENRRIHIFDIGFGENSVDTFSGSALVGRDHTTPTLPHGS
jgi:hypothetical protein